MHKGLSQKINERHKAAAAAYVELGNMSQALKLAGAPPNACTKNQTRTFRRIARNPECQALLQKAKKKITDRRLAEKLSKLLDAKIIAGKDGVELDDNAVQLRATELCLKLRGFLKDERDTEAVVVVVMQQFAPIIMEFIPAERRPELAAKLAAIAQDGQ